MKLYELKIKKPHISDGLFISLIAKRFLEKGFTFLGKGISSFVFSKDHLDHVYKIYNYDNAYYEFARYCIDNPNKHLPKIELVKLSNSNFGIAKVEKLYPINEEKFIKLVREIKNTKYNNEKINSLVDISNSEFKEIHDIIHELVKKIPNNKIDTNDGNILRRQDGTLVINDIFVNMYNKKSDIDNAMSYINNLLDKSNKSEDELNLINKSSSVVTPLYINLDNDNNKKLLIHDNFIDEYYSKFGYITSNLYNGKKNYKIVDKIIELKNITTENFPEIETKKLILLNCNIGNIHLNNDIICIFNSTDIKNLNISCDELRCSSLNGDICEFNNIYNLKINVSELNDVTINNKENYLYGSINASKIKNLKLNSEFNLYRCNIEKLYVNETLNMYNSNIKYVQLNNDENNFYKNNIEILEILKFSNLKFNDNHISKILITKKLREKYGDILNNYEDIIEYIS